MRIHLILFFTLLMLIDLHLRNFLFNEVSYTNSRSFDEQLEQLHSRKDWNLIFIGDSEVHWGMVPKEFDKVVNKNHEGIRSFNLGLDGFGGSWWSLLLPKLLNDDSLQNVEYVVLGVQLTDKLEFLNAESNVTCGSLQKPILTSPFGLDFGLNVLCEKTGLERLKRSLSYPLWITRYSSAVRTYLLPDFMSDGQLIEFNSRKSGAIDLGFEPHQSIREESASYGDELKRWKEQYVPERDFVPLNPAIWNEMTDKDGFFDKMNRLVKSKNKKLILYALPTNPVVIDIFNRRSDYKNNAQLLYTWSKQNGVTFVDLGIHDQVDPELYFSDMRHLSKSGAIQFSQDLAKALHKSLY